MLKIRILLMVAAFAAAAIAQQSETLATSNLRSYTTADLSPEARTAWEQRDNSYASAREQLVGQMAGEAVLELEAKAHGTTPTKLVTARKLTLPDPSDEQVRSTYQANLQALGNKPLEEVRPAIVRFLRKNAEDSLVKAYVEELASKYKINYQTDINTPGIKPGDPLFTVGGRTFTDQEFENKYRLTLYEVKADLIDNINDDLDGTILTDLVNAEASALKIDQQAYVAREVTSKLKTSTDEEKAGLENDLRKRLYAKYNVKFLLSPPAPIAQKISVDDDPARGPINAPVTVVMFADFQCPSCSHTEPILQKVIAEFPGKIRFVARDFPLESIHANAFHAALAANAAKAQGKFWEYGEVLYHNQDALDDASLKKYAAQLGLNARQFEIDFSSEAAAAEVRKDIADGESYGVTGTPTIFVNGIKVRRLTEDAIRETIQNALKTSPGAAAVRTAR
jgi:protein-disulfide isomerase